MGQNLPLISVIIPVYNDAKYLNRCLTSMQNQTYSNLELILAEGGSTDGSDRICDEWCQSHTNAKVLHLENRGVSYSRNQALAVMEGEYFLFQDSDDWLESKTIELLYTAMELDHSDVAGCKFQIRQESQTPDMEEHRSIAELLSIGHTAISSTAFLQTQLLYGDSRCWSKLYRREKLQDVRFVEGLTIGEDMYFVLQYMQHAGTVSLLEYAGHCYYQNTAGAMKRPFQKSAMDQIRCWEMVREQLGDGDRVNSLLLVGILLTAGRIAELPKTEMQAYQQEVQDCISKMKQYYTSGAYRQLDKGYQLKVTLFRMAPNLYLKLYHIWKRKR